MHNTHLKYNTVINRDLLTSFAFIRAAISSLGLVLQNKKSHCAPVIKTLVVSDDWACDWSSYLWLHCARKRLQIMPALCFWKVRGMLPWSIGWQFSSIFPTENIRLLYAIVSAVLGHLLHHSWNPKEVMDYRRAMCPCKVKSPVFMKTTSSQLFLASGSLSHQENKLTQTVLPYI